MLKRDIASVVRLLVCVKWYQSLSYFLMITGDDDGLQNLFTRMGIAAREISAIKLALDNIIQKIKRSSLKIDDQSLTDGM